MELLRKYKHVIWDWNGTLVDDVDYSIKIINKILENRAMKTVSSNYYREIFGFPIKDYYTKLGFDYKSESFEDVADEFIREYNQGSCFCKLYEGVEDILKRIANFNIRQSILSAMSEVDL